MNFLFVVFALILVSLLSYSTNVYAIDLDLECPENKVVIIRTTNPDPICVFDTTANRWVNMGIAEFVLAHTSEEHAISDEPQIPTISEPLVPQTSTKDLDTLPEVLGAFSSAISDFHYENIPDDLSRAVLFGNFFRW